MVWVKISNLYEIKLHNTSWIKSVLTFGSPHDSNSRGVKVYTCLTRQSTPTYADVVTLYAFSFATVIIIMATGSHCLTVNLLAKTAIFFGLISEQLQWAVTCCTPPTLQQVNQVQSGCCADSPPAMCSSKLCLQLLLTDLFIKTTSVCLVAL